MRKLIVIDPAVNTPEVGCFNIIVDQAGMPTTYHLPASVGYESLSHLSNKSALENTAGVVLFGSNCSVNDRLPWQKHLENCLTVFLERRIPILGICYGHQLFAAMHGSKVGPLKSGSQKGVRNVKFQGDFGLNLKKSEGNLVVAHGEEVKDVPPQWRHWSEGDLVHVEGLKHVDAPVWTVQAHPEAEGEFVKGQGFSVEDKDFAYGRSLVQAFLNFCHKRAP